MTVSSRDIVVGYDGSDQAEVALHFAAREAASLHLPLRIVHSFSPPVGGSGLGYGTLLPADALDSMRDGIALNVEKAGEKIRQAHPNLEVSVIVLVGNPAAGVLSEAEGATAVVVGSRGLGGFRGLLLGSTGIQVASHASCPVVVVRGEPSVTAHTVVVGVDGSDLSQAALGWAFDYASRHSYGVRVIHAWTVPSIDFMAAPAAPPADVATISDEEMRATAEAIAGFRTDFPDVNVEERVVQKSAAAALLAEAHDAVAIVVGTRGRGEVMGAVLGSVSQGVLHKAKIPVVVVGSATTSGPVGTGA